MASGFDLYMQLFMLVILIDVHACIRCLGIAIGSITRGHWGTCATKFLSVQSNLVFTIEMCLVS